MGATPSIDLRVGSTRTVAFIISRDLVRRDYRLSIRSTKSTMLRKASLVIADVTREPRSVDVIVRLT
ncbi:hypothetical protein BHM03_00036626 [Ensete ventricosum]|nr:hypothetical protein BHM03_00036626 [Ensete ventricosum]